MKKLSVMFIFIFCAGQLFAQRIAFSVGGGADFDYSANNGWKRTYNGTDIYSGTRTTSIGGHGFIEARFLQVQLGFSRGIITNILSHDSKKESTEGGSAVQMGLSILFKIPLDRGSSSIYPLFGYHYNRVLSMKDREGNPVVFAGLDRAADYSQHGILAGLGARVNMTERHYFRLEAMMGIRFPSPAITEMAELTNKLDGNREVKTTLGFGPRVQMGIGYRF
ncbi:MAG: hypothetical protein FWH12_01070 [Treponema sp.]|nr:hypothetical protein [Treponema sp.]